MFHYVCTVTSEVTMYVADVGHCTPSTWLIFGHGIKWLCDLDLWPFDLGTGAECQT